jgi:type IV pilus assembly protein PilM
MASASDAVWALDLGSSSLKALRLIGSGQAVQVVGFEVIPHAKILSGKGISAAEREELIALSLRQFVQRSGVSEEDVIVSVPGQNSFARFVNLPPVEPKKIPEIVRFEAMQQIPFDINEVQWDWQLMTAADSADKRVGLFAIKNEIVNAEMERFSREDLSVAYVQMAPMALYNYMFFDRPELLASDDRPVVILNIGAEITDLVVCTKSGVWQRCILIGGNAFTQAIADAFKINFEKAEKLKRTAAVSKYARQIFQAMKPVFTDLASEVQKSLGFYTGSNPNARISRIIAMGGGTRLRGLLKYLQQSLQVPVERPDAFKRLALSPSVSAAKFHEGVPELAVAYGLAVQGVGLARIQSNLLPRSIARSIAWAEKTKYFYAAAGLLLVVSLAALGRVGMDLVSYNRNDVVRSQVAGVVDQVKQAQKQLDDEKAKKTDYDTRMQKVFAEFLHRDVVPKLYETILSAMPNGQNNPAQKRLYDAFAAGDIQTVKSIPRRERKQLFVTGLSMRYSDDLAKAQFISTDMAGMPGGGGGMLGAAGMDPRMMAIMAAQDPRRGAQPTPEPSAAAVPAGFVVTIQGYSPYKEIGNLLDPPGVEKEPDKWGLVTRLMHLDTPDANSPFALFGKGSANLKAADFEITKGPVTSAMDTKMPRGIGMTQPSADGVLPGNTERQPLIDPMTKEVISQTVRTGPARPGMAGSALEDNDWWFIVKFKMAWREAPPTPTAAGSADAAVGAPYGTPGATR